MKDTVKECQSLLVCHPSETTEDEQAPLVPAHTHIGHCFVDDLGFA
jgi:hypothetical protein